MIDKLDTTSLIAFCAVLVVGVGGALGATALDAEHLSTGILTFCAGLLVPVGANAQRKEKA